jgi:hypothetical protein
MPGTIEGIVSEVDTGNPIAGARVSVDIPDSGGLRRTATTDQSGVFRLSELPPGRYDLQAEAHGSVPVAVMPLVRLGAAGRVENLRIVMRPLATVVGRVVDEIGTPLASARVEAMAFHQDMHLQDIHLRMLEPVAVATTDERGEFRLSELGPGDYFIRASSDTQGKRRFSPVFYPAATSPDKALTVQAGGHEPVSGVEISLSGRGVRVAGRFLTPGGEAARATAYLIPRTDSILAPPHFISDRSAEKFEFDGVPPGSYYLYAASEFDGPTARPRADYGMYLQWVRVPIEVGNENIESFQVILASTGSIIGRILVSPDAVGAAGLDFSEIQLRAGAAEVTPALSLNIFANVSKDGEFAFDHLSEMAIFLRASGLREGWFISKLILEGSDVTSSGFSTSPGQRRLLEVVINNDGGSLRGILRDGDIPARNARVVLLPDPSLRSNPAFFRIGAAENDGEFAFENVPPGEYTAIAFSSEHGASEAFNDAHWVESYERFGQHFHLAARESLRADITVIR